MNATVATAAFLIQKVHRPSHYLFSAPQKEQFGIQPNKMQQWLKLKMQADLENNVAQQDGPLPYKHNTATLYLGKNFSQQQTGNE